MNEPTSSLESAIALSPAARASALERLHLLGDEAIDGPLDGSTCPPAEAIEPGRWPPLLIALRRTTRPDHARVGAYMHSGGHPRTWSEYRDFLAIHHGWLSALDGRLAEAAALYGAPFSRRRIPALDPDLFMLAVPSAPATAPAAIPPVRSRSEALGFLYVHEAFRLGCRVLARQLRRLGVEPGNGAALLEGLGADTPPAWRQLVDALARVPPAEHSAVVESAAELFRRWQQRIRSLQPRLAPVQDPDGVFAGA